MKKVILALLLVMSAFVWQSCDRTESRYIDLNTGETLELKDSSGIMVNVATGEPVELYVDTKSGDTMYGRTGKVVNGSISRNDGKTWIYVNPDDNDNDEGRKVKSEDGETKIKDGDYKKEVEKDGDITIKDGNTKIKIDGKTGERKVKKDD